MSEYLQNYLSGWREHITGDSDAHASVAASVSDDFELREVNVDALGSAPFKGREGVDAIFTRVDDLADSKFEIVHQFVSEDHSKWAIEWVWTGTRISNGRSWKVRGSVVGTLAPDGKVSSAYEYWNPTLLQLQVGELPGAFGEMMAALDPSQEKKNLAVQWIDAFQTGDVERLRGLSHKDFRHVVWGDMPFCRFRDFDDFLMHPAELGLGEFFVGPIKMNLGTVSCDGDRVFIEAESFAPLRDGTEYNNLYIWVIDVEDGKVKTVKECHDTLHTYRCIPNEAIQGEPKKRMNVLFDEPTYVIDAGSAAESALSMPEG